MMIISSTRSILSAITEKAAENRDQIHVSIFGIVIVGLIAGLIVSLITGPGYTFQGFFLGFAGGSMIMVTVYFFTSQRSGPPR